jgi:hypothetical protein
MYRIAMILAFLFTVVGCYESHEASIVPITMEPLDEDAEPPWATVLPPDAAYAGSGTCIRHDEHGLIGDATYSLDGQWRVYEVSGGSLPPPCWFPCPIYLRGEGRALIDCGFIEDDDTTGTLSGRGTWSETPDGAMVVHIDADFIRTYHLADGDHEVPERMSIAFHGVRYDMDSGYTGMHRLPRDLDCEDALEGCGPYGVGSSLPWAGYAR